MPVPRTEIDTSNRFVVSVNGSGILVMNPPQAPITPEDALVFAAWLVALAEHQASFDFDDARKAVENS